MSTADRAIELFRRSYERRARGLRARVEPE
jgi:hypothetical protein